MVLVPYTVSCRIFIPRPLSQTVFPLGEGHEGEVVTTPVVEYTTVVGIVTQSHYISATPTWYSSSPLLPDRRY